MQYTSTVFELGERTEWDGSHLRRTEAPAQHYGTVTFIDWLVGARITPHIKVWETARQRGKS